MCAEFVDWVEELHPQLAESGLEAKPPLRRAERFTRAREDALFFFDKREAFNAILEARITGREPTFIVPNSPFPISWTADLSKDMRDRLNDAERLFISHVLAFFAASDGIVNEVLVECFSMEYELQRPVVFTASRLCWRKITTRKPTPSSSDIDIYIEDPAQRDYLFDAVETVAD